MKSSFVARMMCNMGRDLTQPRPMRKSKMSRVTTSAVNRLAATPMVSVTPKPLIGPGAHVNQDDGGNQRGDVRVKNGAERAVITRRQRAAQGLALGRFLADALENQHVRVHRHADGQHHARDARQGEGGAEWRT